MKLYNYYVEPGPYTGEMNDKIENTIRTSETTLGVINVVLSSRNPRIKDVSEQMDISQSTALRHLTTLEKHNYVVKDSGTYRLGSRILDLAGAIRSRSAGFEFAENYVEKLVSETDERAQFMIKENASRVILFRRTGEDIIRNRSKIGRKGPLHDTAGGKAMLASLDNNEIQSIIDTHGLSAQTENTIVDEEELFDEIEKIREQGFATSNQEATMGYNAVGCTVKDENGETLGALSVSGPKHRLKDGRLNTDLPELVSKMTEELELKIEFHDSEGTTASEQNIHLERSS